MFPKVPAKPGSTLTNIQNSRIISQICTQTTHLTVSTTMPHCCKLSALQKECSCQEKLPSTFVPGDLDVICARGKQAKSHPGNVRYQQIIENYMDRYVAANSKLQKMSIISEIVAKIRFASPKGGFVKLKDGCWYEVGDHFAREKVSQSLRDNLHVMYRSSCKSKTIRRSIRRRQEEKQKELDEVLKRVVQPSTVIPSKVCSDISSQLPSLVACAPISYPYTFPHHTQHHPVASTTAALAQVFARSQQPTTTESDLLVARILLAQAQQGVL
eukprot:Nitzschia sp. Nitz4//scaffold79_size90958//30334//31225//NITZ4_005017-RA/size90958-augustus-gene-0.168-mRNA-1//1//CDS//3329558225//270//frame0